MEICVHLNACSHKAHAISPLCTVTRHTDIVISRYRNITVAMVTSLVVVETYKSVGLGNMIGGYINNVIVLFH